MDSTRQRIMDSALTLFSEKGLRGTTIRDIAMMAKVNISAINYHFENKENLYKTIIRQYGANNINLAFEAFDPEHIPASKESFSARLNTFANILIRATLDNPELQNLMEREVLQGLPYAREEFKQLMPKLVEHLSRFIRGAQRFLSLTKAT